MRPLDRLLFSEWKRMWRQSLAISGLLACGIATFVMSNSTMHSLTRSMAKYYADYQFGDVFIELTRAPNEIASRLSGLPGVARVEPRIVRDVILDVPHMVEPASCRLISVAEDPAAGLNGVALRRGRLPNASGHPEVIASELFAEAHGFQPGDELSVTMGGRKERLRIVGIGMSPEFVYAVQPGLLLTDNRRFGILWMPRRQMEAAFNMEGAFNNVVLTMRPRASIAEVMFQVDRLTEPFGGIGAYDRSEQESHHRVADEMHQIGSMAFVTPAIFMCVSAFLFNIVLSRLVHQQQEQIATLRAFGYRAWEIGLHYVKLVALLVGFGGLAGCLAGWRLSWWMTDMYVEFFRFPSIQHAFAASDAMLAVGVALLAALLGSASSILKAMKLPPAVAMRPEAPSVSSRSVLERMRVRKLVSPMTRMIVRRLEGNRLSAFLSILGMAMALAVLVLGSFMEDTIAYVIDVQFHRAQRQDVMLTFNENASADALHDVRHLPGVSRAEAFRAVPVRLRRGNHEHRLSLMGLEEQPELYRVLDVSERPVRLPMMPGLTISQKLAELLEVEVGQEIIVQVLEGERRQHRIPIVAIFPDYTNPGAYLNRLELHRWMREGEQLSGAFLAVDSAEIDELYAQVKQTPAIAGVLDKQAALDNFQKIIAENTFVMRTVNTIFASIIALGVIYNCALITLTERSRDLATLRVMGFTRSEVSMVLLGELAIITLLAIPIGLPMGYAFAYLMTLALDTETHRFPLVISRATFAYSACVLLLAAILSALFVRRMLDQLNLIAVLKVKE